MATHLVSLFFFLLSCSIFVSTLAATRSNDDEAALLAFKAAAISSDYDDPLTSWNRSTSSSGYCSWEGVRCRGTHRRVVALSVPSHGLTGILSPAIGNLSSLRTLNLSKNGFSGDIPASLGRLRHLQVLDLSRNTFSGEVPVNLTSCISLMTLDLSFNQLHGCMSPEFGNKLTSLRVLKLATNNLTGTIPASLGNLSSLEFLSLAVNQLEGAIPPSLGGIKCMLYLNLAYNNLFSEPPLSLYNLSSLQVFELQGNMFHGGIPTDIGSRFPSMQILGFQTNQFTGSIPASLFNITTLQILGLSKNRFSGHVPHTIGRISALQQLYLGNNTLEADDVEGWEFITSLSNCSQLQKLILYGNTAFTGQLPSSISNLSKTLQELTFYATGISGRIPSDIGNLANLQVLAMQDTFISGVIPKSISKLRNLEVLGLFNTHLSGLIPSSMGNLTRLTYLDAQHANLKGAIPASLVNMKNLFYLDLSMNHLNGSIPPKIFKLLTLAYYIDLSNNLLSGPIPSEVGSLRNLNFLHLSGNQLCGHIPNEIEKLAVLEELDLANNSFEGSIPRSLSNIKGLSALSLSRNRFSGSIPDAIGSLSNLQQLDLKHNNLSGPIPIIMQNMTSLFLLDLSFNNLLGEVPRAGIFRIFSNFSIVGNNGLCGGIPQLHLPPCHMNSVLKNRKRRSKALKICLAIIGALLFSCFIIALIQLIYKKFGRKHKKSCLPPLVDEQNERVSYHALANGTDGFSEANLLGKGSFAAVYKCTFQDEGTITAVKVFDLEPAGSTKSFVAECEALRRVRHRCLLKIITCCASINHQGQEFKALIFEYMPNGSLNSWLHPKSDMGTPGNTLSLKQRLDIAVDIIDALDYLHNHCHPTIVHCDLKPSNILLAQDMSARVGDFGISRILPERASGTLQNSNSTIGIRGTIGYVAPEYGEGSSVSTLGDVYSLGILLLEMFTGRSPTDDIFVGPLNLHKFAEDVIPHRIWEIVDSTMWLHVDASDNTIRSKIENCLGSVIALGISCSKKQPKERSLMQNAAAEMHAIRDSFLIFTRSVAMLG